jgi:NAD(P)-dependent dehydrogenase (short-subunit alcohol dehydrogenase family)
MRRGLDGAVVLVTGAARGIGEHTARLAAARGARLALVGLEADRLAEVASALGDGHLWFEADVTDQAALDRAVAAVVDAYGRIDAVVANAGIANRGTVATGPVEALARTIEVNLLGVVRTVSATLPHVLTSRGYYLLVSSAAAFTAAPGMAAYCAAKAGVEHFGNALRLEVAHRGVAVGTAHPSWVDTDLVRDSVTDLESFRRTLRRIPGPLGRLTSVQDCAESFVDGIVRRRRRVYVPRAVGFVQQVRTVVLGPLGEAVLRRSARRLVPEMEAEFAAAPQPFGAHSVETRRTGAG